MGTFSGTRLTARDIERRVHDRIALIIARLYQGSIDPPDAIDQLTDLFMESRQAETRVTMTHEGEHTS